MIKVRKGDRVAYIHGVYDHTGMVEEVFRIGKSSWVRIKDDDGSVDEIPQIAIREITKGRAKRTGSLDAHESFEQIQKKLDADEARNRTYRPSHPVRCTCRNCKPELWRDREQVLIFPDETSIQRNIGYKTVDSPPPTRLSYQEVIINNGILDSENAKKLIKNLWDLKRKGSSE